ncbi:hypothetical protein AADZ90_002695 [Aestuariibius sp. 2305UL40-4]|uniref:hypothetical protein n=1 Tax=Aestuariibius violaceus TaxID=3234132 RepID=UPI00345E0E0A
MTAHLSIYEDFADDHGTPGSTSTREADIHAAAYAEGFEEGAAAARAAMEEDRAGDAAALLQHLQEMAFGYHEAVDHVLAELSPFLVTLVSHLLPDFAATALHPQIAALLGEEAQRAAASPLTLRVSEAQLAGVRQLLTDPVRCPVDLIADPDLTTGQAILSRGATETLVDLDALCGRLRDTVTGLLHEQQRKAANG